ncbi:efflux RND transporter periplasmic adaptor subunit [Geosporobacter ferrireducens]|uniref:efflux RND transporter periplasmic adaptor subunit n=1 Tax=Geosporobacter ferrireducens TaxID=1424294 RepID=UPI001471992F|nr:efflux RND transporter periplasmic adaptor subunit [Geosporobacter ferrireducens]
MKAIKNKRSIFLIIAAIVVVAIVLLGAAKNKKLEAGNIESAELSVSVEAKEISPEAIEQYVNVSSKVTANNEITVMPKVSGTVKKVYVNLGDTVKAGDVLFEIDDTNLRLQVEQAEAALSAAQASYAINADVSLENQIIQQQASVDSYEIQYRDLLKDLENTKVLYEHGAVSKQTLDNLQSSTDKMKLQLDTARENLRLIQEKTVQATKKSGQASIAQAQVSLESAQTQLAYTKVKAEIGGVISANNVTVGATVSTQSPAMTIVNTDKLKFSFNIADDYINKVSIGSKVYITISAASETPYEGTVTYISPAADSTTMLYPVEIYIDNRDNNIKSGMFASLKLVVDKRENTVSVPLNAVIERGNEKFVYIVDESNIAHKKIVETGIKNDVNIEIVTGVKNGERVVVKGQTFISDGSTVNVTARN